MLRVLIHHDALNEDVCRNILTLSQDRCVRCGNVTETRRRVQACYVRGRRLCVHCYGRALKSEEESKTCTRGPRVCPRRTLDP